MFASRIQDSAGDTPDSQDASSQEEACPAKCQRGGRPKCPIKRAGILKAAAGLFATQAYHLVTMDGIAQAAGVGKGTIYRHFTTKEGLFLAMLREAVDRSAAVMRCEMVGPEAAAFKLRGVLRAAAEFFQQNEGFMRIIGHHELFRGSEERARWEEKRTEIRQVVRELLEQGKEDGSVRPEVDADLASVMVMASLRNSLRACRGRIAVTELVERLVDMIFNGVATEEARRQTPPRP